MNLKLRKHSFRKWLGWLVYIHKWWWPSLRLTWKPNFWCGAFLHLDEAICRKWKLVNCLFFEVIQLNTCTDREMDGYILFPSSFHNGHQAGISFKTTQASIPWSPTDTALTLRWDIGMLSVLWSAHIWAHYSRKWDTALTHHPCNWIKSSYIPFLPPGANLPTRTFESEYYNKI